jgi:hypothetical protein
MAAARAAEAAHQARPHGPSPLAGVAYDRGLSLLRFSEVPADGAIDEFAGRFAASGTEDRERLRSALTMDDFYTLLSYGARAAVRAVRNGDGAIARRGVAALAAVDISRIDWRDLATRTGLLSYAIGRVGGDVTAVFEAAVPLAEGESAKLFSDRSCQPPSSLSKWRYREVRTSAGIGFIRDADKPYQAKSDLLSIADTVKAGLEDGTWRLSEPEIGTEIKAIWLGAGEPGEAGQAIRSVTGCVTLNGQLATSTPGEAFDQHMLVYLAETENPRAASVIARAAGPGTSDWFAAVSAAAGPLCAIVIARSGRQGIPGKETQASLERFRPVLEDALASPAARSG